METRGKHRDRDKRELDRQYLINVMYETPGLTPRQYHNMLLDHIKERGDNYEVHHAQTCRDIVAIRQNVTRQSGVNLKSMQMDTLEDYNYLIDVAVEELNVRINTDRTEKKIIIEDVNVQEISSLSADEQAVFWRIRSKLKKSRTEITEIRAGSDVIDIITVISKLLKERRVMFGIDEPKKIDTRTSHVHSFQNMTQNQIVDKFKMLGLTSKDKLLKYLSESIDFTEIKKPQAEA